MYNKPLGKGIVFMRGRSAVCMIVVFCSLVVVPVFTAFADDFKSVEGSSAQEVVGGMAGKAGRGVANLATGWLELPKQIYVTTAQDGAAKGILRPHPEQ